MKTIIKKSIISFILTFVLINGKSFATNFSEIKANETSNLSELSVDNNLVENSSINKLEINNKMNSLNNLDINEIEKVYGISQSNQSNETKLDLLTQNLIQTNDYINKTQININNTIVNNNESAVNGVNAVNSVNSVNCTPIAFHNNTNNEVRLLPLN